MKRPIPALSLQRGFAPGVEPHPPCKIARPTWSELQVRRRHRNAFRLALSAWATHPLDVFRKPLSRISVKAVSDQWASALTNRACGSKGWTMAKRKRVALYLRVSTSEQSTKNQRRELEKVSERHGWQVVAVFEDAGISGAKGRDGRPGLDAMMKA